MADEPRSAVEPGTAGRGALPPTWLQRLSWRKRDRPRPTARRPLWKTGSAPGRRDGNRRRSVHPRFDPVAEIPGGRRLRAGDAVFRRSDQRGGCLEADRLYPFARQCSAAPARLARGATMSVVTAEPARRESAAGEPNYFLAGTSIRSWLLTHDHKRIALLYFASITFFFFIGGAAATLIRLEL